MPKISDVEVYGLERTIRTAKYPKAVDIDTLTADITPGIQACTSCNTGEGHDNALKGIIVQFDLTMSNKAWVEGERYHWFEIVSSQSTMHKLNKFNVAEQCNKYVDDRIIAVLQEKIDTYNALVARKASGEDISNDVIATARLFMLYNTPSGFELTAGMTTNYQQLKTIYQQRRHHALPDWQMICDWIETLPMFMELTQKGWSNNERD